MKPLWLVLPLLALVIVACASAATPLPTPVPTRIGALTKAEAIGLIQQYLQDRSCSSKGVNLNARYEVGGIWTVWHTTDNAYSWQLFERTGAIVARDRKC